MKNSFISSKSFKVRAKVSVGIVLIVLIGALTPESWGLRIAYIAAAIISLCEVASVMAQGKLKEFSYALSSILILIFSMAYVIILPQAFLIISIALTMASDTGAYMVGKICGTKLIHSRPFPVVSPNKSWEGLIGGVAIPGLIIPVLNYLFRDILPGRPLPIIIGCLAGVCAILGDTLESAFKRSSEVKDANDFLKNDPIFRHLEALLGGREGHGGYYDRLDSMSMVLCIWGIVTIFTCVP